MRVFLVDYPMVPPGVSITPAKMEKRRKEIIEEIHALLRPHSHLIHTRLADDFTAIGNAIYLRFQLELNQQSVLPFQGELSDHEILENERELLTRESTSLQQRINRLTVSVTSQRQQGELSKYDEDSRSLLKVVKSYSGKSFKVRFYHDELELSFPELPPFKFGRAQVIEAKVLRMLEGDQIQIAIKPEPSSKKLKKYLGLCQFRKDVSVDQMHMVIAFSKRMCRPIQMRIRSVCQIGEDAPCHFEILDLPNFHSLHREMLDFMNSRVDSDL